MKFLISTITILVLSSFSYAQSGRRAKEIKVPVPVPAPEAPANDSKREPAAADQPTAVTAERNQDYRCTDDGTLERILDESETQGSSGATSARERIFTAKEVDSRVVITARPQPAYTREARRNGIQGVVVVKVLLSGDGKVSRVRVVKGLQAGLTESAIRAACKMKFKPASKDGEPVSQWVIAEYMFRLADSSIFRP